MIYELIYEDLTHLGGPMGTEYTTRRSLGLFDSIDKAKTKANKSLKDTSRGTKKMGKWIRETNGMRSQDLGHVMYHIVAREVS